MTNLEDQIKELEIALENSWDDQEKDPSNPWNSVDYPTPYEFSRWMEDWHQYRSYLNDKIDRLKWQQKHPILNELKEMRFGNWLRMTLKHLSGLSILRGF